MKIDKYLFELLKKHECVVVPGFGAFITQQVSAAHVPAQHKFFPPSKVVSFNRLITKNDGILIQYISSLNHAPYSEIQIQLQNVVAEWNSQLDNNQSINIKNIGKIYKQYDHKINFIPDLAENLSLKSYGLIPTKHIPIDRKADTILPKNIPVVNQVNIKKSNNKKLELERKNKTRRRKYVASIIASLIFGVAFLQLFFFADAPLKLNEANFIAFSNSKNTSSIIIDGQITHQTFLLKPDLIKREKQLTIVQNDIQLNPITEPKNIESKVSDITNSSEQNNNGYYIVLGCFKETKNANKLYSKLLNEGKKPYKKVNSNGSTLVAEFASRNKLEAEKLLTNKQSEQPDVWLKFVK